MSLSHIFHLSDLHIRNGDNTYSRHQEYTNVFNETILSIKQKIYTLNLSSNHFIIIITGDIFHNKFVIGNYGLLIYRTFIISNVDINNVKVLNAIFSLTIPNNSLNKLL